MSRKCKPCKVMARTWEAAGDRGEERERAPNLYNAQIKAKKGNTSVYPISDLTKSLKLGARINNG